MLMLSDIRRTNLSLKWRGHVWQLRSTQECKAWKSIQSIFERVQLSKSNPILRVFHYWNFRLIIRTLKFQLIALMKYIIYRLSS